MIIYHKLLQKGEKKETAALSEVKYEELSKVMMTVIFILLSGPLP